MQTFHREQLDALVCQGCDDPNCSGELYIHSSCHERAPTWTKYNKRKGCVIVECSICEREIACIEIAYEQVPEA